jgi:type I restriction enzyme S subunit
MSEDPDFDMEVVGDDELDDIGADGASSSADDGTRSDRKTTGVEVSEHSRSGSNRGTGPDKGTASANREEKIFVRGGDVEGWKEKTLGSIFDSIYSGGTPKKGVDEYYGGDLPFVKIEDLNRQQGNGISSAETHITEKAVEETSTRAFDAGTLLLTIYGSLAETALVRNRVATNQAILGLWDAEEENTLYVKYAIDYDQAKLQSLSRQTTQANLGKGIVAKHRLSVPPLPEQRKIASVLYAVDQAIQKTEEVIEQHRTFRQALINHLFSEGLSTHSEILDRDDLKILEGGISTDMDRTSVGRSPSSWKRVRLSEVTLESSYGVAESAQDFDPHLLRYVRITDISADGRLKDEDPASLPADAIDQKYLLSAGDLLFARSGATVGKTLLYRDHHPKSVYAGYLIRFVPDTRKVLPEYLFYYTQTRSYQKWVTRVTRKGAQENINAQEYGSILLPLPPLEEQEAIIELLEQERKAISEEIAQEKQLKRMKIGLMQDLLTGEVRTADKAIETLDEVKAHE